MLFISSYASVAFSNPLLKQLEKQSVPSADEAFIFSAHKLDEGSMILTWALKENCFLYENKFKVDSDDIELEPFDIIGEAVEIQDIYFGEVKVYFNLISKKYKFQDETDEINITYQGCNEKGFCYPPISKKIKPKNLNYL